jgi:hypothetical protein
MNRALLLALLSLFVSFSPNATTKAGSIVYEIQNYAALQNGYTLSGTITTDGTIGTLTSADITAWSFSVTGPSSYGSSSLSPGAGTQVNGVTATAAAITMAPSAPDSDFGSLQFFSDSPPVLNYGRADANDGNGDRYSSLSFPTQAWITFGGYPPGLQLGGSTWIIATANVSAVPEPSTLTLALLGVVCLAVAHSMTRS